MERRIFLLGVFLSSVLAAQAGGKKDAHGHKHKEHHSAHVHGEAQLTISVENATSLFALLEAPGESVVGFEHQAKSEKDKAKETAALNLLKEQIGKMLILNPDLGCVITPVSAQIQREKGDSHSEVHAKYSVSCAKEHTGSKVSFAFAKQFPRLRKLKVTVMGEKGQSAVVVEQDKGEVQL